MQFVPETRAGLWLGVRLIRQVGTVVTVVAATLLLAPGALAGPSAATQPAATGSCPWKNSTQPVSRRVAEVIHAMTLNDEISLVEGHGVPPATPYVFYEPGNARLCIPGLGLEDGPSGVADGLTGVTQLASGVALAASWDRSLANRYGQVVGAEEAGKGASVDLGPTVNIDRDPRWGRSFESYSEDPFLTQGLGVPEINGLQSRREMAQVKHYDVYNQETNRNTPQDDVIVSDRTLHEIYMPAFQAAVQQAHAASLMCAYSSVNGNYSCESRYLLTDVLRELWDFPGYVTSDYQAIHSTTAAEDGTDMEQPFNTYFGTPLETAVQSGAIPRAVVNTMVQRILTEMFRFGFIDRPQGGSTSATVTSPGHRALSTQVADAGTTLLKNDGGTLPITSSNAGTVAVIGPAASPAPVDAGGGSAYVIPSGTVTPLQGIQNAAGAGTNVTYTQGLPTDDSLPAIPASNLSPAYPSGGTPFGGNYQGTLTAPETGTYVLAIKNPCGCYTPTLVSLDNQEIIDDPGTPPVSVYSHPVHLVAGQQYSVTIHGASSDFSWGTPSYLAPGIAQAVSAAGSASRAVVVVSDDTESEATDRPGLDLPSAQNELISAVAAANPHTVVVIDAGAPVTMPWLHQVAAVLDAWYPGQTNGTSLAHVLFGQVNPGGHLPVTFPVNLTQVPAATPPQFPGTGGQVFYSEGIDVGYRWYDSHAITPLFPFGYGLSYTRFKFSSLSVAPARVDGVHDVRVSATITNVGKSAGSDVAQLYLGDPPATGEPPRQLVGFQRVNLNAGKSARLQFTITPRDTWWWEDNRGWNQTVGPYRVYVGDSSALANLPLQGGFVMTSAVGDRQVGVSAPSQIGEGKPVVVKVTLGAGGTETLHNVSLTVQVPQGFASHPLGATKFATVTPAQAVTACYSIQAPTYLPAVNAVVHGTGLLGGDASREAGALVAVTPGSSGSSGSSSGCPPSFTG